MNPTTQPIRVLVVDDEEQVLRALCRYLHRAGVDVIGASNAKVALELIAAEPIDVALVDLQLPGISGEDLIARLHTAAPELRCIVLSGTCDARQLARLRSAPNVCMVMSKPWAREELLEAIAEAGRDGENDSRAAA